MKTFIQISILAASIFAMSSCNNEATTEEQTATTETEAVDTVEVVPTQPEEVVADTTQPATAVDSTHAH